MESAVPPQRTGPIAGELTAALAWWRDAGVDYDYTDEPTSWLIAADEAAAAPAVSFARAAPEPPAPPPQVPFGGDRSAWPADLAGFGDWWLSEPTLDEGQLGLRVAPRGVAGARLMILVPQPEVDDTERLLAGPEGRLLDAFLAAAGLTAEDTYVASVLPRHTPHADWASLAGRGVAAVLAHHVGLAAPQRLIAFGATILPLLGHDPTHSAQILRTFNHEGRSVPLLAARDLGALLARPAWKAGFWRAWLDWTGQ